MTLYEFNNLDFEERYNYIWFTKEGVNINCFRDDGDYKCTLWDCGTFFVESSVLNGKTIKIEGIELTDDRVNLFIDWLNEHKDDPKYELQ